mmetsp:Transcript_21754/g.32504  ORF Transcript_21754/g.32504 Transcript_21754/m.32504 type:complete len:262 (-) Transcript_21754:2237-3022(-)
MHRRNNRCTRSSFTSVGVASPDISILLRQLWMRSRCNKTISVARCNRVGLNPSRSCCWLMRLLHLLLIRRLLRLRHLLLMMIGGGLHLLWLMRLLLHLHLHWLLVGGRRCLGSLLLLVRCWLLLMAISVATILTSTLHLLGLGSSRSGGGFWSWHRSGRGRLCPSRFSRSLIGVVGPAAVRICQLVPSSWKCSDSRFWCSSCHRTVGLCSPACFIRLLLLLHLSSRGRRNTDVDKSKRKGGWIFRHCIYTLLSTAVIQSTF